MEDEAPGLEEVVVIDREPVMVHGAAKVTVHRPSLVISKYSLTSI